MPGSGFLLFAANLVDENSSSVLFYFAFHYGGQTSLHERERPGTTLSRLCPVIASHTRSPAVKVKCTMLLGKLHRKNIFNAWMTGIILEQGLKSRNQFS